MGDAAGCRTDSTLGVDTLIAGAAGLAGLLVCAMTGAAGAQIGFRGFELAFGAAGPITSVAPAGFVVGLGARWVLTPRIDWRLQLERTAFGTEVRYDTGTRGEGSGFADPSQYVYALLFGLRFSSSARRVRVTSDFGLGVASYQKTDLRSSGFRGLVFGPVVSTAIGMATAIDRHFEGILMAAYTHAFDLDYGSGVPWASSADALGYLSIRAGVVLRP